MLFNDMLGTTLGIVRGWDSDIVNRRNEDLQCTKLTPNGFAHTEATTFGETKNKNLFYTGQIEIAKLTKTFSTESVKRTFKLLKDNNIPIPQPILDDGAKTWDDVYNTIKGAPDKESLRILPLKNPGDVPATCGSTAPVFIRIDRATAIGEVYDEDGNPTGVRSSFKWQADFAHELMHAYRHIKGTYTGDPAMEEKQIAVLVGNALNKILSE
jgi:hypothetical protein